MPFGYKSSPHHERSTAQFPGSEFDPCRTLYDICRCDNLTDSAWRVATSLETLIFLSKPSITTSSKGFLERPPFGTFASSARGGTHALPILRTGVGSQANIAEARRTGLASPRTAARACRSA